MILYLLVLNYIYSVDNQFKEKNPHPENLSAFQTNTDGTSTKRDLKFHHNSLW